MRILLLILVSLGLSGALRAQYIVINVKDTVYANGKALKKKDKISESAKLRFSSASAYAYVISPGKGYFILGVKDRKKVKGEFMVALKEALIPPNDYYVAATRANETYTSDVFEDQYDLKAFFREELFFIAPAKFKVSAQHFPLDSNRFFMIRHQFSDGWVSKALPQSEQAFEITPKVLQLQDKVWSEKSIQHSELYYVNQETGEQQFLGRFNIHFPSAALIQEELTSLRNASGGISTEQFVREHAMPYLNLQYGKTQPEAIKQLIEKNPKN